MTKRDKVIAFLKKRNCKQLTSTSAKYLKFSRPDDPQSFYWVGNNGALRTGKTVSESISLSGVVKL